MKRLLTLLFLLTPAVAFAQDNGGGGMSDVLKQVIGMLIMGIGVPLAVRALTAVWPAAPTWLKTIAGPILAPTLVFAGSWLTAFLGVPIDFSSIVDVITTAAVGLGASIAYTMGKAKGKFG